MTQRTLYVYADETGDDTFTPDGTRYFAIAAYATTSPHIGATLVHNLLYRLQAEGVGRRGDSDRGYSFLHANQDHPSVRARVYPIIDATADRTTSYVAFIDKRKMHPSIRSMAKMYEIAAGAIAKYIAKQASSYDIERVVFAYDQALSRKDRARVKKTLKPALAEIGIPYTLMFDAIGHEPNGQIADYIAWAWCRSRERQDHEPLKQIPRTHQKLRELDLFESGRTYFY